MPIRRRLSVSSMIPAQLLDRHRGAFGREIADRLVGEVDALDLRLEDAVGQVAADARDGVAHVGDGAVDRRADLELDEGVAAAFADRSS